MPYDARMQKAQLPQPLVPVAAPLAAEFAERVVRSLGSHAKASIELCARGLAPPNALVGMNLLLLSSQPREPREEGAPGPIAGGVWVREQVTVHRPVRIDEALETRGELVRRFVRKGRRYSVTVSQTRDAQAKLVVSTCTTGLVRYRPDPALLDEEEGLREDQVSKPEPDALVAARNPSSAALRALRAGERLEGSEALVTLALMRVRDGARPRNPIHTDPDAAREAGLDAPIAGGSHVLGFVQELLMDRLGTEALLHGACTDVQWVAPVRAETRVRPVARVVAFGAAGVEIGLEAHCEGVLAMRGRLVLPLGSEA
jgi:acyl dehydratase